MKLHALVLFAAGLLLAADAPKDDAVQKELDKMQGTWTIVSAERDGKSDDHYKGNKVTITGNMFTSKAGDKVVRQGTMKLNPAENPKAMDSTYTLGLEPGTVLLAIYELKDDTWKLCFAAKGAKRPTEFSSKPGSGHLLLMVQRDK